MNASYAKPEPPAITELMQTVERIRAMRSEIHRWINSQLMLALAKQPALAAVVTGMSAQDKVAILRTRGNPSLESLVLKVSEGLAVVDLRLDCAARSSETPVGRALLEAQAELAMVLKSIGGAE